MSGKVRGFGTIPHREIRAAMLAGLPPPADWNSWKIQRVLATPPWSDMERIRKVYEAAKAMTAATGVQWTVGHVVPLNHPRVCGLHVYYNLKPEPASTNSSKGNAWCEYHGELFDNPEQFKLF